MICQQNFTVPNTEAFRKRCMGKVRRLWKDFKSRLTKEYIRGPKKHLDPCLNWTYLSREDWKKFYASRVDPIFQVHVFLCFISTSFTHYMCSTMVINF